MPPNWDVPCGNAHAKWAVLRSNAYTTALLCSYAVQYTTTIQTI